MNERKTEPPRVKALKKSTSDLIERINKRLQAGSWYHSTQVGMLEVADMMLNAVNKIYKACGKAECSAAFAPEITNERFTAIETAIMEISRQRAEPAPEATCEEPIDIHEEIAETSMEEIFGNRRTI